MAKESPNKHEHDAATKSLAGTSEAKEGNH
jgi:hypothetical protein